MGIDRWFTPSKSDNQSGAQYNAAYNASQVIAPSVSGAADAAKSKLNARKRSSNILTDPYMSSATVKKNSLLGLTEEEMKKATLG